MARSCVTWCPRSFADELDESTRCEPEARIDAVRCRGVTEVPAPPFGREDLTNGGGTNGCDAFLGIADLFPGAGGERVDAALGVANLFPRAGGERVDAALGVANLFPGAGGERVDVAIVAGTGSSSGVVERKSIGGVGDANRVETEGCDVLVGIDGPMLVSGLRARMCAVSCFGDTDGGGPADGRDTLVGIADLVPRESGERTSGSLGRKSFSGRSGAIMFLMPTGDSRINGNGGGTNG